MCERVCFLCSNTEPFAHVRRCLLIELMTLLDLKINMQALYVDENKKEMFQG